MRRRSAAGGSRRRPRWGGCPSPACPRCRRTGSAWRSAIVPPSRSGSARTAPARARRPRASAASLLPSLERDRPSSTSSIIAPISRNSAAPKPRVVAAGRAEPDAGGDRRLLRIERDGVLVGGDVGALQAGLGRLAGDVLGPQVDQHQVAVGAAGDDRKALLRSGFRPAPWRCRPPPSGRRGTPAAAPRRTRRPCRR